VSVAAALLCFLIMGAGASFSALNVRIGSGQQATMVGVAQVIEYSSSEWVLLRPGSFASGPPDRSRSPHHFIFPVLAQAVDKHGRPISTLYGYVPTRWICILFVVLFVISTGASPSTAYASLLIRKKSSPPLWASRIHPPMVALSNSGTVRYC
jgi:hypothetical protein